MDVHLRPGFETGPGGRRGRLSAPADRSGVIDTLFPHEEVLTDFLAGDPLIERLPMLSRWDPFGRPYHHWGGELKMIVAEIEQARACVQDSDTSLMLGKLSWLARRALAKGLVMTLLPDWATTRRRTATVLRERAEARRDRPRCTGRGVRGCR